MSPGMLPVAFAASATDRALRAVELGPAFSPMRARGDTMVSKLSNGAPFECGAHAAARGDDLSRIARTARRALTGAIQARFAPPP